jgi:hypothetical protein
MNIIIEIKSQEKIDNNYLIEICHKSTTEKSIEKFINNI